VRALDDFAAHRAIELVEWEVRKSLVVEPGFFDWGDESKAGVVKNEGFPTGTFFAARQGRWMFVLRVTGMQLDGAQLRALLLPRLEQLTRFGEPAADGG
jgi:hypothetical protein